MKYPIEKQRKIFLQIVLKNPIIKNILDNGFVDNIDNWYLVAGCLNQTLWNHITNKKLENNILDYDLIYFDNDLSEEKQNKIRDSIKNKYKNLNVNLDVVNQARVHIWIEKEWGLKMRPLVSTEDAIASWPITVSCIGIRKEKNKYIIMAPYGLTDNLEMVLRPNKTTVMRKSDFEYKVNKWQKNWPELTILPW